MSLTSSFYYLFYYLLFGISVITTGDEDDYPWCYVTALMGQLSVFNQEEETISAYLERTNIFFEANKIEEDKYFVS